MQRTKVRRVLPGFGLSLGFTLGYLSLIVLIPLSAVFFRASHLGPTEFWGAVTSPRVVASYKLSFGASLLAATINVIFGLMLAWTLVRYTFPGRRIVDALIDLRADIGVATEALIDTPDIVAFPYCSWHHSVVVPAGHALEGAPKLTLETLADYPLITYNESFTGRGKIDAAFAAAGLAPDIVMSALDADAIKSYVELGLGAGIIASMAFEPERDTNLRLLDATGLFPLNTSRIAVRQGRYLRGYAYRFIELCSPELTEAFIRSSVTPKGEPEVG